jgi:DNA invertase Pin-like site-specific DNA recombinase
MFREFCQAHNLTPSGEAFVDAGLSGYHAKHIKKGRLKALIEAAESKAFEPGTVIVVEAWDRLGRQEPPVQTALIERLVRTGVSIGVCRMGQIFTRDDLNTTHWITLAAFVQMAYQESRQKADRVKDAWKSRRAAAGKEGKSLPCAAPAWMEVVDYRAKVGGALRLLPERAAAVKRIFELAAQGYGQARIIKQLTKEGHAPFTGMGRLSGKWTKAYVHLLLRDRRVLGEMRLKDGTILTDYLPQIVDPTTFAVVQAALKNRDTHLNNKGGQARNRDAAHVNVFKSVLRHARDGEGFVLHNQGARGGRRLVLLNRAGEQGRGPRYTFPYDIFEEAVLQTLWEVDPAEATPQAAGPNLVAALRERLKGVQKGVAFLKDELAANPSKAMADVLRRKEDEETEVATQLQAEVAKAACPTSQAWDALAALVGTVAGRESDLVRLVKAGGDEARLQLRPLVRRVVESIWVLTVRRGSYLLAAVQVHFHDGPARRDLRIIYQAAGHQRPGGWRLLLGSGDPDGPDLRRTEGAARVEQELLRWRLPRLP